MHVVKLVKPGNSRATRELRNRRAVMPPKGTIYRTYNLAASALVRFQLQNPGWTGAVINVYAAARAS